MNNVRKLIISGILAIALVAGVVTLVTRRNSKPAETPVSESKKDDQTPAPNSNSEA